MQFKNFYNDLTTDLKISYFGYMYCMRDFDKALKEMGAHCKTYYNLFSNTIKKIIRLKTI